MNRGKRGKVLNEVKPVENIRMYRVFLREVLRKKKKIFPSHELQDHAY